MNKKGMGSAAIVIIVLLAMAITSGAVWMVMKGSDLKNDAAALADSGAPGQPTQSQLNGCPDDGDSSLYLDVYNSLNETGSENYDVTYYILGEDGNVVTTVSDTTSPSATTIDCGYKYVLKAIAADGASGDNSHFVDIRGKPVSSDAKIVDGGIQFTADRSNINLKSGMTQHGTLQFKLYDNEDARYAYNADEEPQDNTDWETDGVTFRDGGNTTAFAVSSGGFLDHSLKVKGVQTDTDFNDAYVLLAVEAPVDKWNKPNVVWNGKSLEDIKDSLPSDEATALNSYEYVYKITDDIEDDIHTLDFYMDTCSGCDPTADVELDFYAAGNYLSTSGTTVKTGAAKDDSSKTAVFTVQDIAIDVS